MSRVTDQNEHHCNFGMVPNRLAEFRWAGKPLSVFAKALYLHYVYLAGKHRVTDASCRSIAEALDLSMTVVRQARAALAGAGFITVVTNGPVGQQTTDVTVLRYWREDCTCGYYTPSAGEGGTTSADAPPSAGEGVPSATLRGSRQTHKVRAPASSPEDGVDPKDNLRAARNGSTETTTGNGDLRPYIDAIRARGLPVQGSARDGKAVKEAVPHPDPEVVAEAYETFEEWAGWKAKGDGVSIRVVVENLSAFLMWGSMDERPSIEVWVCRRCGADTQTNDPNHPEPCQRPPKQLNGTAHVNGSAQTNGLTPALADLHHLVVASAPGGDDDEKLLF